MPTPESRISHIEAKLASNDEWRAHTTRTLDKLTDIADRLVRLDMHSAELAKSVAALQIKFEALDAKIDARLKVIEAEMPTVKQARDGGFHLAKLIAAIVISSATTAIGTQVLQRSAPAAPPAHQPAISAPHTSD